MGEYKRKHLVSEQSDLVLNGSGTYHDYNFWKVAGVAIGGKDKGQSENELAPTDIHSLMP